MAPANAIPVVEKSSYHIAKPSKVIGRIKYYNSFLQKYGPWQNIERNVAAYTPFQTSLHYNDTNIKQCADIPLKHGGTLKFYFNLIPEWRRIEISKTMKECQLYRQYTFKKIYMEPRVHVLLSSSATESPNQISSPTVYGYQYKGVKMKPHPLSSLPVIHKLADDIARHFNLPNLEWNIGVDLTVYRDGKDGIGWHCDDSQGENIILTLVVAMTDEEWKVDETKSTRKMRPLQIRRKRRCRWRNINNEKSSNLITHRNQLGHEDEFIELYVGQGDAYMMDGKYPAI